MKHLDEQVAHHNSQAQLAALQRRRLQAVSSITTSPAWPDYKSELQQLVQDSLTELENTALVDTHDIGVVRGRIKILKQLLRLEEMQEKEVARLSAAEKHHRDKAEAKSKFQTRQHTGAKL